METLLNWQSAIGNQLDSLRHLIRSPMRYLPKSPADREAMLEAIGARSINDLFEPIPGQYRLKRDLKVPRQMAESEIMDWFDQCSRENSDEYSIFLGAGAYYHYRPVIIDSGYCLRSHPVSEFRRDH